MYKYAQNNLSKDTMEKLEKECERFEQEAKHNNLQEKYLDMITEFEARV